MTGTLKNGQTFVSAAKVFNRDFSFYTPDQVAQAQNRQAANPTRLAVSVAQIDRKVGLTGAVIMSAAVMGPGVSTFFTRSSPPRSPGRRRRSSISSA